MKIWLILVFVGRIGGAFGPLPINWNGCLKMQKAAEEDIDQKFIEHYAWVDGRARWLVRRDMGARCVVSQSTPKLADF